jgi:hypothetical protein
LGKMVVIDVPQNLFQSDEGPVEFAARPKRIKTPKPKTMTKQAQSPPPRRVKQQSQDLAKMYNIKQAIRPPIIIKADSRIRVKTAEAIPTMKATATPSALTRKSICTQGDTRKKGFRRRRAAHATPAIPE